jgi:methyl-accepting chemotaxis protein
MVVMIAALAVLVLGLGVGVTLVVGHVTIGSIRRIADAVTHLDDQETLDLDGLERKDELGSVVAALAVFRARSREAVRSASERALMAEQAQKAEEQRQLDLRELEDRNRRVQRDTAVQLASRFESSIANLIAKVGRAATELERNAHRLEIAAEDNQRHSGDLDSIAERFAHEMTDAGADANTLSDAIRLIDQQVSESVQVAALMLERADVARQSVSDTSDKADGINRIVTSIDEIARQTNMLALNATIEATRSGSAGRGFAVVAEEIKALSRRTGVSTFDARTRISEVQSGVRGVVSATDELNMLIARMNRVAEHVATATRAQARSTEAIGQRVGSASHRARAVAEASANIRISTQANQEAVLELQEMAIELRTTVDDLEKYSSEYLKSILVA